MKFKSPAQKEIYLHYVDKIDNDRVCPTFPEVARDLGYSNSKSVAYHVSNLIEDNWLERDKKGNHRDIKIARRI